MDDMFESRKVWGKGYSFCRNGLGGGACPGTRDRGMGGCRMLVVIQSMRSCHVGHGYHRDDKKQHHAGR